MTNYSGKNKLTVAVVIPCYGREKLLARTLDSIAHAIWPPAFTHVRVVENGPRGKVESVVDDYRGQLRAIYQNEPKLGAGAARNAGVTALNEDFVIFFDNDVRLGHECLVGYRRAIDQWGPGAFYGGPVWPDYVAPPPGWLCSFLPPSAAGFNLGDDQDIDEPLFRGASMAYPRQALIDAGGFDSIGATSERGGVGEETRLQRWFLAAGYQGRYVREARVWHFVPPENCSPDWAIGRAYRHGITKSLEDRRRGRKYGIRRWMIRRAATLELQYWLARLRGKSLEQYFSTAWERSYFRGVLAGCYDGKNDGERLVSDGGNDAG